ncbi:MAG TPA: tRNA pseudouridine(55) synthase TruB [Polyangiaceae bacterium]|nr:tRNA pseudouridine(55) synthase TruB [Polyangiaceae bacterium]
MTPHGVLVVDKPRGPTSHDVVSAARRALHTREIGHAGTLDPMASGVLVLLVGEATKLSSYLALDEKTYVATVTFGVGTATLDAEGEVTERSPTPPLLTDAALARALDEELARTLQVPPAFSAISVGGRRAHRMARRGEAPDLPPRPVTLRAARLLGRTADTATFELHVSKGYYVRSFARDLGATLGVAAHLSALERRASGPYTLADAVPHPLPPEPRMLSLSDAACRALPSVRLLPDGLVRCRHGKQLTVADFESAPPGGVSAFLTPGGGLAAIGEPDGEGGFRVRRGFHDDL